jgi:hypothetical protein
LGAQPRNSRDNRKTPRLKLRAARRVSVQDALEIVGVENRRVGAAVAVGPRTARSELINEALKVVDVEDEGIVLPSQLAAQRDTITGFARLAATGIRRSYGV